MEVAAKLANLTLIIGSTGGLGAALLTQLKSNASYTKAIGLSRSTQVSVNYDDETSIAKAAQHIADLCAELNLQLRLLVVATGFLHGDQGQPERSFTNLDAAYLQHVFKINTLGPALVMRHFLPLLPKSGRCVAGFVSAKVGSIGDNALGGWYGYRASKAALNQLLKRRRLSWRGATKAAFASACIPARWRLHSVSRSPKQV